MFLSALVIEGIERWVQWTIVHWGERWKPEEISEEIIWRVPQTKEIVSFQASWDWKLEQRIWV